MKSATRTLAILLFCSSAGAVEIFEYPGTHLIIWDLQPGATSIVVECIGAGGGGGRNTQNGKGGGGGGAFAKSKFNRPQGRWDVSSIYIGTGGGDDTNGEDTWFKIDRNQIDFSLKAAGGEGAARRGGVPGGKAENSTVISKRRAGTEDLR